MPGKSAAFSNAFLSLVFEGKPLAGLFQNDTLAPTTVIYISLHNADPTPNGNQSTNEVAYSVYTRVGVIRTAAGWNISGEVLTPVSPILFPVSTGGNDVASYFGIGQNFSGPGFLFYAGALNPPITCSISIQPQMTNMTSLTEV